MPIMVDGRPLPTGSIVKRLVRGSVLLFIIYQTLVYLSTQPLPQERNPYANGYSNTAGYLPGPPGLPPQQYSQNLQSQSFPKQPDKFESSSSKSFNVEDSWINSRNQQELRDVVEAAKAHQPLPKKPTEAPDMPSLQRYREVASQKGESNPLLADEKRPDQSASFDAHNFGFKKGMRRYGDEAAEERGPNGGFTKIPRKFDFHDYKNTPVVGASEHHFQNLAPENVFTHKLGQNEFVKAAQDNLEKMGFRESKVRTFDDLIPQEDRQKFVDDEREKQEALSREQDVPNDGQDDEEYEDDEDSEDSTSEDDDKVAHGDDYYYENDEPEHSDEAPTNNNPANSNAEIGESEQDQKNRIFSNSFGAAPGLDGFFNLNDQRNAIEKVAEVSIDDAANKDTLEDDDYEDEEQLAAQPGSVAFQKTGPTDIKEIVPKSPWEMLKEDALKSAPMAPSMSWSNTNDNSRSSNNVLFQSLKPEEHGNQMNMAWPGHPGAYQSKMEQAKAKRRAAKRAQRHGKKGNFKIDARHDEFAGSLMKDVQEFGLERTRHKNEMPKEDDRLYKPNTDQYCPKWEPDFTESVKPMLNLDRTKFVTPVLTYGPNNQLRGFRETIWLAIRLNRTIVVPPFFKHDRTDAAESTGKGSIIPPEHRLSINALRQLLPVADARSMGGHCDKKYSFDVFFNTKRKLCSNNKMLRMNTMNSWMGLSNMRRYSAKAKECDLDLPILPRDMTQLPRAGPIRMPSDERQVKAIYGTEASCALWLFPYHTVGFTKILDYELSVDFEALAKYPDDYGNWWKGDISLMSAIVQYTPRPKYIQDMGKRVTEELFGYDASYMAMHWRYDKNDWVLHCQRESYASSQTCQTVMRALEAPKEVSRKVVDHIQALLDQDVYLKGLYIAAPLDAQDLVDAITQGVIDSGIENFKVATATQSMPIVQNMYPDCEYIKNQLHDMFSLIDMEICTRSLIFSRSGGSSWSLNVAQERKVHGIDDRDFENLSLLSDGKLDLDFEEEK